MGNIDTAIHNVLKILNNHKLRISTLHIAFHFFVSIYMWIILRKKIETYLS